MDLNCACNINRNRFLADAKIDRLEILAEGNANLARFDRKKHHKRKHFGEFLFDSGYYRNGFGSRCNDCCFGRRRPYRYGYGYRY